MPVEAARDDEMTGWLGNLEPSIDSTFSLANSLPAPEGPFEEICQFSPKTALRRERKPGAGLLETAGPAEKMPLREALRRGAAPPPRAEPPLAWRW